MNASQALGTLKLLEEDIIEFKNMVEIVALCAKKKSVIRLVMAANKIDTAKKHFSAYFEEYSYALAPFGLINAFSGSTVDHFQRRVDIHEHPDGDRVIFFGTTRGIAQALELESAACGNLEASYTYGYPSCCALAYDSIERGRCWIEACLSNTPGVVRLPALANRFSTLVGAQLGVHLDYFPCSIDCSDTLSINKTNRNCLSLSPLADFLPSINEHINATVIWWGGYLWYIKGTSLQEHKIFSRPIKPFVFSPSIACPGAIEGIAYHGSRAEILINGKWLSCRGGSSPCMILFEENSDHG